MCPKEGLLLLLLSFVAFDEGRHSLLAPKAQRESYWQRWRMGLMAASHFQAGVRIS